MSVYARALATAIVAMSISGSGASAADLYAKAPLYKTPVPLVYHWTGFYVGAQVGYVSGNVTVGAAGVPAASSIDPSGFVGSVQGGYDYQFANNFVLGARFAVPIVSLSENTPGAGVTYQGKVKSAVILGGRLGYAYGNSLPYLIAAYVRGKGEGSTLGFTTATATHSGFLIGLGYEYLFAPHWSLDATYSYISMSKATYNFANVAFIAQYGFNSHNFMIGANYRF